MSLPRFKGYHYPIQLLSFRALIFRIILLYLLVLLVHFIKLWHLTIYLDGQLWELSQYPIYSLL